MEKLFTYHKLKLNYFGNASDVSLKHKNFVEFHRNFFCLVCVCHAKNITIINYEIALQQH